MSEQIRRSRPTRARLQSSRIPGRRYNSRFRRAHHGQTLIVALSVLFILLFIGGIFVTRVARNLTDSARGRDIADARALAEAGLKYCDNELNGSEEGADWRPQPSAPIASGNNGGVTDPDYFWLEKGFTRLSLKGGRALVRVSYDPDPANPVGQAIKIESVGRTGEIDPTDPTVFVQNQPSPRLRRELIAYKRIGITDYLRFMTDKNNRGGENFLGVPAIGHYFPMVFGNPMLASSQYAGGTNLGETLYGGSIYCNANLSIMGDAYFYEGPRGVYNPTNGNGDASLQQEGIFVAGNISANQFTDPSIAQLPSYASATATRFDPTTRKPLQQSFINMMPDGSPSFNVPSIPPVAYGGPITATNDYNTTTKQFGPNLLFNAYGGKLRDGSGQAASNGSTRGITRLKPPSIDTFINDTGQLRVRAMTSQSGNWISSSFNTGTTGWGRAVYINNNADKQEETLTPGITGSYSLPADWTNPNAGFAQSAWQGPYYRPPGVLIELLGDRMRLTRTDGQPFLKSDGLPETKQGNGSILEIPFSDEDRAGLPNVVPFAHDGDEPFTGTGADPRSSGDNKFTVDPHSYGVNIVLFAEGNIRVKGVYGTLTDLSKAVKALSRVHLTLITGGTAYVEGNLIKGDGTVSGAGGQVILQRNSTCQIIAKDYVCVNTSMFVQPQNQTNVWNRDASAGFDEFYTEIGLPRTTYDTTFSNGISPTSYNDITIGSAATKQILFLRHAALTPGPTAINMLINPAQDNGTGNTAYIWQFGQGPSTTYPLGTRFFGGIEIADDSATSPRFEAKGFPQLGNTAATNAAQSYTTYPGYDNLFRIQIDQTLAAAQNGLSVTGLQSYLLSAVAVAPLDIRIEAALYAQDKSFFIIPGYSFNPDPNDTRAAFATSGRRTSYKVNLTGNALQFEDSALDKTEKDLFPYHNEPLDVRITFCGAIAENYTANIGAQAAWLSRWGYTAATYGSTAQSIPDDHLQARQPAASPNLPVGYVAGDPGGLDYRSQLESQTDLNTPHANDFALTRALLFEYDPTLAMPYFHSTDAALTGAGNRNLRLSRSLRFTQRTVSYGINNSKVFRQLLPALPRLPIGPDLIYSGASDALVGENQFDTDLYTGP
jgi:hypothetical protein